MPITKDAAVAALSMFLPGTHPNPCVYVSVIARSSSGMSRRVRVYGAPHAHDIHDVTGLVAAACDFRQNKDSGDIIIRGCGFNVAQHVADSMARVLGVESQPLRYCSL